MVDSRTASRILFATSALAAAGYGAVSLLVSRGKMSRRDRLLQHELHKHRGQGLKQAAELSAPLGKWYAHLPTALATARKLQKSGHVPAAVAVVASSLGAALLSRSLKRLMKHRSPPPERGKPLAQSFPSGHALETSALALTSGYVLIREGMTPGWSAAPLTVASIASGAGRWVLDRHWSSDLLGGYLAGVALGAACAGTYELVRER